MTDDILTRLAYDPETGVFTSKKTGKKVGSVNSQGYLVISCMGFVRNAHRFAWLLTYGVWPDGQVDHINGDKLDNRIVNLRSVSAKMNSQNQRKAMTTNAIGYLGVSRSRERYRADISVNGKANFLGRFDTPEDAHLAYVCAKRALHPGCTL